MKFSHENLEIWQLGMKLVELVYSFRKRFLPEDKFGLQDQLTRAAEAVPRDIAEGYGKNSRKERALYMERAKSETAEVDTSFKQAVQKGRITEKEYQELVLPLIKELYFKIIAYRKWLLEISQAKRFPISTKALADPPSSEGAIPHFNQAPKGRSSTGFTLIEVLVIVFLVGLIVIVGGNLFFSILKGASKTGITKEVKQNGDYALGVMERAIRNAQEIVQNSDGQTCTSAMNKIKVKAVDGGETEFGCVSEDGVAKIASGSGRLTGKNLTLGATCPGSLSFSCDEVSFPPKVTISFTLSQKGTAGRPEEKAQISFQTTVSLRNY